MDTWHAGRILAIALLAVGCSSAPSSTPSTSDLNDLMDHGLLVMGDVTTPGTPIDQVSIFTVRADGTGRTVLTGKGNQYPSWTPDGKIIFVSNRTGAPEIWIMEADSASRRTTPPGRPTACGSSTIAGRPTPTARARTRST